MAELAVESPGFVIFREAPSPGKLIEVAPGILWTRMPLPFLLDHVNIYLIEDPNGWVVVDTGIANDATKRLWEEILSGPMKGRRISRILATHYHPDHIGLAGWLCARTGASLVMGQMTYLMTSNISLRPGALEADVYRDLYLANGATAQTADVVSTSGHAYLRLVSPLPPTFIRIVAGEELTLGGRTFEVLTGDGHAPEQMMLYCRTDKLLFSADQVIEKITPNIGVWAVDPEGDPLGLFLRSLERLCRKAPDETLVLSGHRLPFTHLHVRCEEIIEHHRIRCELVASATAERPQTVAELVPVLFKRRLDAHQLSFAFGETLAHVNYMVKRGELRWDISDGVRSVKSSGRFA